MNFLAGVDINRWVPIIFNNPTKSPYPPLSKTKAKIPGCDFGSPTLLNNLFRTQTQKSLTPLLKNGGHQLRRALSSAGLLLLSQLAAGLAAFGIGKRWSLLGVVVLFPFGEKKICSTVRAGDGLVFGHFVYVSRDPGEAVPGPLPD